MADTQLQPVTISDSAISYPTRNILERTPDSESSFRAAMQGVQAELHTAMPGFVVNFGAKEFDGNVVLTATVKPTIKSRRRTETGWESIEIPIVQDVPIIFPNGGGCSMTFPIKEGDEVLLIFAERCIDAWWQSGLVSEQQILRMHDLSDGFALIGPRSLARLLPDYSMDKMQIRTDSGNTLIEIDPVNESISIKCQNTITIDCPTAHFTGGVTADGDITANTISLQHHIHGGVQAGGGETGEPNP